MQDAFAHCEGLVRAADKDRFLSTLFAPAEHRNALLSLYAFNLEIARVREVAQEALAGEIRLQRRCSQPSRAISCRRSDFRHCSMRVDSISTTSRCAPWPISKRMQRVCLPGLSRSRQEFLPAASIPGC